MYTCDPDLEIVGSFAHALMASINRENFYDIMEAHGLEDIDPTAWYSVRQILDVFNAMEARSGAMFDFVSIGMALTAEAVHANGRPQLADFLTAYPERHNGVHRNGDPGKIIVEHIAENYVVVTLRIPYPDDLFYGIFYGFTRQLVPHGSLFSVKYDESCPRRDEGGDSTIIHIQWE